MQACKLLKLPIDDAFKNDKVTKPEALYMYAYELVERRQCLTCKKPIKFNGLDVGYEIYCSSSCLNIHKNLINKIDGRSFSFKEYTEQARILTERSANTVVDIKKRGESYHLDHKFSIADGFNNKISPSIIAHKNNLRVIPADVNLAKGPASCISISELLRLTR